MFQRMRLRDIALPATRLAARRIGIFFLDLFPGAMRARSLETDDSQCGTERSLRQAGQELYGEGSMRLGDLRGTA